MPKINYSLEKGIGLWSSFSRGEDELTLLFYPQADGYIKVEDTVYRVKSGKVAIPLAELRDGDYALRLETEGEGFALEKFSKNGREIRMHKTDDATVRHLIKKAGCNSKRLDVLEEKIESLLKKTEGHHIFN